MSDLEIIEGIDKLTQAFTLKITEFHSMIKRLEKETIELKDSAECEKYVVAKLTEEIIDLRKERDLYREALKKYETMSASVQNLDMAAREALAKGREITDFDKP